MRRPPLNDPLRAVERALSGALNRVLLSDEQRATRLAGLAGTLIEVCVRDTSWRLFAEPGAHGVRLLRTHEARADVRIVGRPADFIAFARSTRRGAALGAGRIEIAGDLAVAQQVQALLGELAIDWADVLAPLIGEVAAHQVTRLFEHGFRLAGGAARRIEGDLAEWLKYEAELTPTPAELSQFARAVATVADDVERLAARLRRLQRGRPGS